MESGSSAQPLAQAPMSGLVKESSPPHSEGGRGSPPPNCAICLSQCQNKSFTDSCLHQFCFNCLLTWSKIKAECPLCKQPFKSIIHNVRSSHQYEEYLVEQHEETIETHLPEGLSVETNRFRYRTTLTLHRRESIAIQRLLLRHSLLPDMLPAPPGPAPRVAPRPRAFRATVYRYNLWARPLPDITGRFRECSPPFFRYNPAQIHRLVPWLGRELSFLLRDNAAHVAVLLTRITDLLPIHQIQSPNFRAELTPYLANHTEHFLHEFQCFASSPYDMNGYDRHAQYQSGGPRTNSYVDEVISSESDSDIVLVSSQPGTSGRVNPQRSSTMDALDLTNLHSSMPFSDVAIETISHSDTDDSSSEVVMVGYIKPPQDRTPEVVDLLASDSDVVPLENSPTAPISTPERPLVKLSVKRVRNARRDPETPEPEPSTSSMRKRRCTRSRRSASHDSDTTVSTHRDTPCSFTDSPKNSMSNWSDSDSWPLNSNSSHLGQEEGVAERTKKCRKKWSKHSMSDASSESDKPLNEILRSCGGKPKIAEKAKQRKSKRSKVKKSKSSSHAKPKTRGKRIYSDDSDSDTPSQERKRKSKSRKSKNEPSKTKSKARSEKEVKNSANSSSPPTRDAVSNQDTEDYNLPGTSGLNHTQTDHSGSDYGVRPKVKSVVNVVSNSRDHSANSNNSPLEQLAGGIDIGDSIWSMSAFQGAESLLDIKDSDLVFNNRESPSFLPNILCSLFESNNDRNCYATPSEEDWQPRSPNAPLNLSLKK